MKHHWLACAAMIAGCGTTPNGDVYNRTWRFSPETAEIDSTQSNGAAWDPDNSAPDAFVHMYFATFDDQGVETDVELGTTPQDESYAPVWTFDAEAVVFSGDTLSVDVIDSDTLDDDTILSCDIELTRAVANAGEATCDGAQATFHLAIDVL